MIEKIHIENYKSISSLDLELGRVTVLIGENGSGKSNILEAITLASAASQNKLDNEFLASRGIRTNDPQFMKSAFSEQQYPLRIKIRISDKNQYERIYNLSNNGGIYDQWQLDHEGFQHFKKKHLKLEKEIIELGNELIDLEKELDEIANKSTKEFSSSTAKKDLDDFTKKFLSYKEKRADIESRTDTLKQLLETPALHKTFDYVIFSPENSALRKFEQETQIEPLGINGEGLYKLLKVTAETEPKKIEIIKKNMGLIGWFKDFDLPENQFGSSEIIIKDKYIKDVNFKLYNHKNTNEGFLFLLFYLLLFVSDKTPKFFAIDNIDASLNPKLCTKLTESIVELAKKYDKQVILTTHNPAILDGLNLYDDEQKILVVSRKTSGHTKVKKLKPPRVEEGEIPIKLSEAFLNGMIGGLPKTF
ncbi:SMC domain protein [[Leptolyngbya] sp. PCC 7376]|uniref:AAA family ATPase n=1 Tax=[Leptolyngbya] sp. PCC 7376 TaxID=111781 RepID=UPI00029ED78F|nr:AAA family ATPase [[Leptolyngbya] sp. PCC 7376]AFY37523.1 SMC domain protein [[Leptolyngbya] sp. PCC 7376]